MKDLKIRKIDRPDRMISYWKAEWKAALIIFVTGILYNGAMGLGPVLQGKIIDMIAAGEEPDAIVKAITVFISVICAIQFSRYLKRYYVRIFAGRTSGNMRMLVYKSIVERDPMKLVDESAGDLMTRAISDVGECVEGMRKFTTEIFDTGILMAAYFVMLLYYDVKLTVMAVVFIPAAMFIAERMKKTIYKYSKSYRAQLSKVSGITLEDVENELIFRMNGVEDVKHQEYEIQLEDLRKKAVLANILENSMQPVYKTVALIGIVLVVLYGGEKVVGGLWTIGTFSAYVTIFTSFSNKASKAAKLFNSVQKAQVSWQRIKPYLCAVKEGASEGYSKVSSDDAQNPEISGGAADVNAAASGSTADTAGTGAASSTADTAGECAASGSQPVSLTVTDVSCGIIESAEFQAETGQIIGITGPVASGKSTLGRILQGFCPYKGSVKINGRELRDMSAAENSRAVSYMGHDSQLLFDTIYNNITLGCDGDIRKVLADVCFDEDLKSMPEGIETKVGASGVRLSGGQQARLALARALYNKSRILVLDDPFSAVDVNTEAKIMDNLRKHYSDCIILLISHRTSAFDRTENVLLLDRGKTRFDTHQNLLNTSQTYRNIICGEEGDCHV